MIGFHGIGNSHMFEDEEMGNYHPEIENGDSNGDNETGIICRAVVSFSCYSLNVTIGLSLSAQVAIPVFVFSLIWMPKIFLSSVYFRTGFPAKSNT